MYSFSCLKPACCPMSSSNYCFLTCKQVSQEAGQVFLYLSEFSTVYCDLNSQRLWHSVKQKYVFLELSCFFNYPANVAFLISDSFAFSKTSLNIWKFTIHVLLKPGLDHFVHSLLACEMSAIVQ